MSRTTDSAYSKAIVNSLSQSLLDLQLSATFSRRGIVLIFRRQKGRRVNSGTTGFGYVHLPLINDATASALQDARDGGSEQASPELIFTTLQRILLGRLRSEPDLGDRFSRLIATAICIHAERYQWCTTAKRRSGVGGLMSWQEEHAKSYLEGHIGEPLAVQEVARRFGMSAPHFSKCFKMSTGLPPYRWLLKRRIEWAKELLRSSSATIADVSLICGFAEQSHFTNKFRKEVGMAPGTWRQANRQK